MKKIYIAATACAALLVLTACGKNNQKSLKISIDDQVDLVKSSSDEEFYNVNIELENTSKKAVQIEEIEVIDSSDNEIEPEFSSDRGAFNTSKIQADKTAKGFLSLPLDKDKDYTLVVNYHESDNDNKDLESKIQFNTKNVNDVEEKFKKALDTYLDIVVKGKEIDDNAKSLLSNDLSKEVSSYDTSLLSSVSKYTFDKYSLTDTDKQGILKAMKELYAKNNFEIESGAVTTEKANFEVMIPRIDWTKDDSYNKFVDSLKEKYSSSSSSLSYNERQKNMQKDLAKKLPELIKNSDLDTSNTKEMDITVVYNSDDKKYEVKS